MTKTKKKEESFLGKTQRSIMVKPVWLLSVLILCTFSIEWCIMMVLPHIFPLMSIHFEAIADSLILAIFLFPILFFLVFRPLTQRITEDFLDILARKHTEALLDESKKKAEDANKVKSQFLANMSHEIRTPLSALIGFAELLNDTPLNPVQKDYVDTLRKSGEALHSLVADILDFSKIEAQEIHLENIDFDLEYLVNNVVKIVGPKLRGEQVVLYCSVDENVPCRFKGDPTRIRQVLMNLLSNAVKFTEKGEIEVGVTVKKESIRNAGDKMRTLEISVRDTGIGIPSDKQQSIFVAFEQADVSTTRKYGGTGLGLSVCKALAAMMGGNISVASEPGKGSVFSFTLKLEEAPLLGTKDIFPLTPEQLEGKRVLIADDNEKIRQLLEIYCKDAKMIVVHKSSGAQEVLDWLAAREELPDIILANIMMPEMNDGYEMVAWIRKDKKYEKVKIIAVTGSAGPGVSQKVQEAGFDAYLPKPIIKSDLLGIIKTVLGDQREKSDKAPILTRHSSEELFCKGLKILVVEDNIVMQKLLSIVLGNLGAEIETASNGVVAVEKVKANQYDLVLMDLQMPEMGGCEATRIIREQVSKILPIIALTAAAFKDDREASLASGMNDFISKPIDLNKFREKIKQWVKKEGSLTAKQKAMQELRIPEELWNELVQDFSKQAEVTIEELKVALAEKNFEEIRKKAHFIKGSAGNLRMDEIYRIAKDMEFNAAENKDIEKLQSDFENFKQAFVELKRNV